MRVLPAGDRALLVELASLTQVLALFQSATDDRLPGVTEVVPAARTLLVQFDAHAVAAPAVTGWLLRLSRPLEARGAGALQPPPPSRRVEIPVHYTGEDLDEVASMLGVSPAEVVERHTGCDYLAAFAGFAPGFVYLTGGDPCFNGMPRRAVPRTRVPASSVAIGGDFSAVYPSDSPGGWRLLGVTPLRMWDLNRTSPALVQPGFGVRFRDLAAPGVHYSLPAGSSEAAAEAAPAAGDVDTVSGLGAVAASGTTHPDPAAAVSGATPVSGVSPFDMDTCGPAWFEVLAPGMQTLVQDLGRPGMTALGVSGSGVLDRGAAAAANQLVGNPPGAAVLENVWGGLTLVCHGRAAVAVTGAPVAVVLTTASGMRVPAAAGARLVVEDGQTLRLGRPRAGLRCYLAVGGGWDAPEILGSRATDVLSGIGPAPLRKGDRLQVAGSAGDPMMATGVPPIAHAARAGQGVTRDVARQAQAASVQAFPQPGDELHLDVVLGPRDDWFDAAALDHLQHQAWTVTAQSNRVGLRLEGPQPLARLPLGELPSEGMVAGALEVPPSGQPVLFLADHPLTGGYPVVAVVVDRDLDRLAQVSPGVQLRFRVV